MSQGRPIQDGWPWSFAITYEAESLNEWTRRHWSRRAKSDTLSLAVRQFSRAAGVPIPLPTPVEFEIWVVRPRRRSNRGHDVDNAVPKVLIDAIRKAGLLPDDDDRRLPAIGLRNHYEPSLRRPETWVFARPDVPPPITWAERQG